MKQYCLVGPVDKRVVAYPLIRVLSNTGKVLVITDDANFRRFSDEYTTKFVMGQDAYVIVADIIEYLETIDIQNVAYDYVVYITTDDIIQGCDKLVYCHGSNLSISTPNTLDALENKEYVDILISNTHSGDKKQIKIGVNADTLGYVWLCEETKEYRPCTSKELSKVSAMVFAETLDGDARSAEGYLNILCKKGVKSK